MSTPTATPVISTKNLYQRIRAVMSDVEYLKKDKAVSTGGSGSYQALSEEKVTENVREALIRHGLVILPVYQEQRMEDLVRGPGKIVSLTTVNTQYKIVNVDVPSEFELLASSGTGVDSQDKGVGKAMTYSYKYLLLRTFGIATGNDTDSVGNAELEQQQAAQAEKAIAGAIVLLEAATSEEELKKVGVKEYMSDPKYKAAALAAAARVKAGQTAPATEAVDSGAAVESGEPVLATEAQKEEIIKLLNHPAITATEKAKMQKALDKLTPDAALETTNKLRKAISDRQVTPATA